MGHTRNFKPEKSERMPANKQKLTCGPKDEVGP